LDVKAEDEKKEKESTLFLEHAVIWYAALFFRRGTRDVGLEGYSPSVIDEGIRRVQELLSHIDARTIEYCYMGDIWELDKVRILAMGKHQEVSCKATLYLQGVDVKRSEMLCYAYSMEDTQFSLYFDEQRAESVLCKKTPLNCWGHIWGNQVWFIVPYRQEVRFMTVRFRDIFCDVYDKYHRKRYKLFPINTVAQEYKNDEVNPNLWLLMDRGERADDNAEHLYRYIHLFHPEREIFYVLRRNSPHWVKLKKEGFRLVALFSPQHKCLFAKADRIISSHYTDDVLRPYGQPFSPKRYFVFLQHGVIMGDMSFTINCLPVTSLLLCSTYKEYESIASLDSPYWLSKDRITFSGCPRHDALLRLSKKFKERKTSNLIILIMPTWRRYITLKTVPINQFHATQYAFYWNSFLHSAKMQDLSRQYQCRVFLIPHKEIMPYFKKWELPKYVVRGAYNKKNIQQLFAESALMITDYSSVAFEMAYIRKPVIYYQFDKKEFFSRHYPRGYFNHHCDGFGPVATREQDLLVELEKLLKRNCQPELRYLQRMKETFSFRDGKCCERVYQALCKL
jgi:hypothetical protein